MFNRGQCCGKTAKEMKGGGSQSKHSDEYFCTSKDTTIIQTLTYLSSNHSLLLLKGHRSFQDY